MSYGLVLAGGGVRGAYHIGVWKALREMEIDIEAIAGTSIGAINGALMISGAEEAEELWNEIAIGDIVKLSEEMAKEKNLFNIKNITKLIKEIEESGGLDMTPLENLLRRTVDEDKIRNSPIDFGCAMYSVNRKKDVCKFKDEMEKGSLIDYLMASACFVGFKIREIGEDRYIDGGISNNMPVDMILKKGIRDIITVDVKGVGIVKNTDTTGCNVINITSTQVLTGTMDFDKHGIKRYIKEGYYDCKKAFGEYMGKIYSFPAEEYLRARKKYSADFITGLEKAADIFGIDRFKEYSIDSLEKCVFERYKIFHEKEITPMEFIKCIENDTANDVVMTWAADNMEKSKSDFIKSKLNILGDIYHAASTLCYLKKKY